MADGRGASGLFLGKGMVGAVKTQGSLTVCWFPPRQEGEAPLRRVLPVVANSYIAGHSNISVGDRRYQFFTSIV